GVSTIHSGHYPSLPTCGRAASPDAYLSSDASRAFEADAKANAIIAVGQGFVGFSGGCGSEPKVVRLTGLENVGPERTRVRPLGRGSVNSPSRITLENNEKIRPQPDRENAFARASGGQ
ncbi:hypothetical protein, partial [Tabrizicola sp.]|uniref:hypothetical protein n=1 Tax=Tabrizicola sp. TaxID=2005166 RepID=UPI0025EDC975